MFCLLYSSQKRKEKGEKIHLRNWSHKVFENLICNEDYIMHNMRLPGFTAESSFNHIQVSKGVWTSETSETTLTSRLLLFAISLRKIVWTWL
jgi:hypothetical protein